MSYWKSKVLPKIKKYFDKPGKKKAATEACISFDASKESIEKEIQEKQEELQPKVVEVYKSIDAETKIIVKNPTADAIKKQPKPVQKLLEELVKIGFPGASQASEAASKYGPALVLGPVTYILQKTYTFIAEEVEAEAPPTEAAAEVPAVEAAAEPTKESETSVETIVEEVKTDAGAVVETVETVEETTTDQDGKKVVTVEVTETVVEPEPAK